MRLAILFAVFTLLLMLSLAIAGCGREEKREAPAVCPCPPAAKGCACRAGQGCICLPGCKCPPVSPKGDLCPCGESCCNADCRRAAKFRSDCGYSAPEMCPCKVSAPAPKVDCCPAPAPAPKECPCPEQIKIAPLIVIAPAPIIRPCVPAPVIVIPVGPRPHYPHHRMLEARPNRAPFLPHNWIVWPWNWNRPIQPWWLPKR